MAIDPLTRRRRVLVIAEAANPEWVSVPLVGWSLATALRAVADVQIVTQIRNREAFLRAGLIEGQDFTAIDSEAFARPAWKAAELLRMGEGKGWTMVQALGALSYPHFERLVWRHFGAAIRRGDYDIVHRVTPLSPTVISPIAARCARAGVPFVLGPLNGGVPWLRGFEAERRAEREWLSYLRGAYRWLPGRGRMLDSAAAILAGSRHTASEVPPQHRDKVIYLPENAIDPARFNRHAAPAPGGLRAAFVGRLVPYKGADMLLDAAAPLLRAGRMRLELVGDGPMRESLAARTEALGLGASVTFHGWQAHAEVQDILAQCHILSFPSIREFGGGVVLEAMALGVVPLVVDYAGPGELVTEATGLKVPSGDRAAITRDLARVLERLAENPATLTPMADAARARVARHFTWERKAEQIARVYDWCLAGADGPPPDLFADNAPGRQSAGAGSASPRR